MGFRDDREAMRARVAQLEEDLDVAQRALAEARQEAPVAALSVPSDRAAKIAGLATLLLIAGALLSGFWWSGSRGELAGVVLAALASLSLSLALVMLMVSRLLVVVAPNQLAVLSGRQHQAADGSVRGYRLVRGGRVLRLPLIESVSFMDLSMLLIALEGVQAYARGGANLRLDAVAGVKVSGDDPLASRAVEWFLDRPRADIQRVAEQTLEGALRGVVAELPPDEVSQRPEAVAQRVLAESEADFQRLGLIVDSFKLRQVSVS